MRFNSKELSLLVQHTTQFDKEGHLVMKDKQDGLFKKSEIYINRYIRLKGNLLFYFKSKDGKSDPIGVLILERCAVELDVNEEVPNGFILVYEGEDHAFKFGASTEAERDSWIQALHIASHECLKMQLQSLREQLQARTGKDPVVLPTAPNSRVDFEFHSEAASEDPVIEISLACTNLPSDLNDAPPSALTVVHTIIPPQQQIWMHHNHTEIVERNSNPQFLKTIGFGDKYGVDTSTRVRLTVHHVIERMTGMMAQLGQAIFTLQEILLSPDLTLHLTLKSHDAKEGGNVAVTAWINDDKVSLTQLRKQQEKGSYSKRPRTMSLGRHSHNLQSHFASVLKRSFRFATNDEKSVLQVSEYMGESKWCFDIPVQLLKLWVSEEKRMITILQDLGELPFDQGYIRQEVSDYCMSAVCLFNQHVAYLNDFEGMTFKRSVDKGVQELEFVPVNLHMDRMVVTEDSNTTGKVYDMATHGAFAAHCRDMKSGGLKKLLHHLRTSYKPDESMNQRTRIERACIALNEVTDLRSQIKTLCEKLCQVLEEANVDKLKGIMGSMKEKVTRLHSLCGEPIILLSAEAYLSAKSNANTSEGADMASLTNMPDKQGQGQEVEKTWKWSGSNFVKSPTMEPWEVTKLNLEAAFVCLLSVVEEVIKRVESNETGTGFTAEEIKSAVSKMESFVEIVWARISLFLNFIVIMENKGQVKTAHDLKIRRDVCNAHSITTLVSSFLARTLTDKFKDPQYLKQLMTVGILFEVEGLLSCYSSEMVMLEDTLVAVDDLRDVSFRLVQGDDFGLVPKLSLGSHVRTGVYADISRHNIIVDVPIPKEDFSYLPKELQQGKLIQVTPVLFNIGINQLATLAEKFGSTAFQDNINSESFAKLYEYYFLFNSYFEDPMDSNQGVGSLNHMVKLLQSNIMTKKSKNIDVLHMAAEVTHHLGGLRSTMCKSGKDRTSMGVTLEMVQILQREHNLASHVFMQSLDCLRSVGCRRENVKKNTGINKYAFVSLQMLYIPKLYRAPSGTYAKLPT